MIKPGMKKIGLTQRVTLVENYQEHRDSLDQRWWPLCSALGFMPIPLPNLPATNVAAYAEALDLSAIILTGGNSLNPLDSDAAPERDAFELALIKWAVQEQLPILGVCHGMQIINHYFAGTLSPIENHVATHHAINFCGPWENLAPRTVNSYHNFGIFPAGLGQTLDIAALHADGSIEALMHTEKKIAGIMWHPERETPTTAADIELLKGLLL